MNGSVRHLERMLRAGAVALLVVGFGSGCRTYGGYGTEEKAVAAIERMNEQFARSLARAEGDLAALQDMARTTSRLMPVAEEFAAVMADHARLLESHRQDVDRLKSGPSGYRASSRLLGGIVTDHQLTAHRYQVVVGRAAGMDRGRVSEPRPHSLYQQVPPHYIRLENRAAEPRLDSPLRQES